MKTDMRLIVVFSAAAAILLMVYLAKRSTDPQSAIIAGERERLYASRDDVRMKQDLIYAGALGDRLAFLDYRTAVAYNDEQQPDKAIVILRRLINDEETREEGGIRRRSRSYANEADYYDVLHTSFELKHDEAEANRALDRRMQLLSRAREQRRLEKRETGKYVGTAED
jgi:hypothetical protein